MPDSIWLESALLATGAVLGVFADRAFTAAHRPLAGWSDARRKRKRTLLLQTSKVYEWLERYYETRGATSDLYRCHIDGYEIIIPFLTKPQWHDFRPVELQADRTVDYAESEQQAFPVDKKLLEKRRRIGQKLFDEPAVYLDYLSSPEERPVVHIKTCTYFQIATNLIRLEEETFRGIRTGGVDRTPFRSRCLPNADAAAAARAKPFPVGCAVVFAVRTPTGYEFVIHTRSHATVTFGGARTVTPNYGLVPIIGQPGPGELSVLHYNFVKEYLEELYCYEELNQFAGQRRADSLWFQQLPEAQELLSSPSFRLESTGFGFNALNGVAVIAMLARVDDIALGRRIKEGVKGNWEIAERDEGRPSIEFVAFDSPKLKEWLMKKDYNPASAFAIARAIERLRDPGHAV